MIIHSNSFSDQEEQAPSVPLGKIKMSPREFICPDQAFQITLGDFLEKLSPAALKVSLGLPELELILNQGESLLRFRKPLLYLTRLEWKRPNCTKSAIWKGTPHLLFPRNAPANEVPALVYQCGWVRVTLPLNHLVSRFEHFLAVSR